MATTIRVRTETKEALRRLASGGETYDDVISELLSEHSAFVDSLLDRLDDKGFRDAEEVLDELDKIASAPRGPEKAQKARKA